MELRLAFSNPKPGRRHPHRRDIGAPTLVLAIAAMAEQREQRLPRQLIPHPPAQTPAAPHVDIISTSCRPARRHDTASLGEGASRARPPRPPEPEESGPSAFPSGSAAGDRSRTGPTAVRATADPTASTLPIAAAGAA